MGEALLRKDMPSPRSKCIFLFFEKFKIRSDCFDNPLPQCYINRVRQRKESFLPGFNQGNISESHGGELGKGRRKSRRPIDPKQALHVVLRSSRARGEYSMLRSKNCNAIHRFTEELAQKWGVKLYRYANVGNHIHLLIKVPSRAVWQRFLRELTGGIAIIVTGAKKGYALKPNETGRGFWDHLAFTRIVHFGRDFAGVSCYVIKNLFEASGVPMKRLLGQGYRLLTVSKDGILRGAPS
jgi:REP element-mobilizing transposase RayT